jgi:hypothetical protein
MANKTEQTGKKSKPKADRTAPERRKNLTPEQIKELELAGGVEGGMQAGSAGGPGEETAEPPKDQSKR